VTPPHRKHEHSIGSVGGDNESRSAWSDSAELRWSSAAVEHPL
jgi:hypothetical protein